MKFNKLIVLVSLFPFILSNVFAQKVIRGPYLQQPTADGVTIRWRTDIATSSEVITTSETGMVNEFKTEILTTEHSIGLTGLQAGKKYEYSIGAIDRKLKENANQYIVITPAATTNPITFWAMGDFGASNTAKYVVNQQEVRQQFLKQKSHADLWVWLGDNSYCCGFDTEYQTQVFDFYGDEILGNMPILPSPGNHEYYGNYPEFETLKKSRDIPYFDIVTTPTKGESGGIPSGVEAYYSVDYGNVHFVSLDSYGYDDELYPLADKRSKQYQWLERDLAANKLLWTVVFFHHPPFTKRSHDSDAEPELQRIRETLVPVFDKYQVDVVLSGHSHVYERSYLMKGHSGHSTSFNKNQHVVQETNAFYSKDSPPIINKEDGTIYMVIGSAGRLDWNGRPDPHPSSIYSDYKMGGSSFFTVTDNRLDSEWICADGEIRDKFTVFKNVNKKTSYQLAYGDSLELSASWSGNYRWSELDKQTKSVTVSPRKNTTFIVTDSLGYLRDTFLVSVSPQPVIKTQINANQVFCEGRPLNIAFTVNNTDFEKWTYRVELSDAVGSFENPVVLANGKQRNFTVTLPQNTNLNGTGYQIRVMPNGDIFEVISSQNFRINSVSSARFTNDSPLPFSEKVTLKVFVEGTLPAELKITSLESKVIENQQVEFDVSVTQPLVFKIEKLSNICGEGIVDDRTIEILPPLGLENEGDKVSVFPNPTNELLIIETADLRNEAVEIKIYTISGVQVSSKKLRFNNRHEMRIDKLSAGTYFLEINAESKKINRRFTVQ
ncbi:MAG: metallophosphoesterase [Spirosomaceae bacterium]|nr:metallophosphoesterase [Spirosomataceae bacterium]